MIRGLLDYFATELAIWAPLLGWVAAGWGVAFLAVGWNPLTVLVDVLIGGEE